MYTIVGLLTTGVFLTICNNFAISPKYTEVSLLQGSAAVSPAKAARPPSVSTPAAEKGLGRTLHLVEGNGRSSSVTAPKLTERPLLRHFSDVEFQQENILKEHAADLSKVR
jgi:hypothetical protein